MDIDLDMPHAVPDDSDDDEGDDPCDELHNLGVGDEEEVEDEDIATLEQAIAAVAALQSNSAEPAPDMAVLATDVAMPAANVAVPAADVAVPAADVAVPAADVVVDVPAVDVTVHCAKAAKPAAPSAQRSRRSHELLFKLCCLDALDKGARKRKILQDNVLDKKTLRGRISQKEELLQAARDAITFGRRIKGKCRLAAGGFKTKYGQLDANMMAWWIKTKREEKQRVMRPRILREIR